LGKVTLGKRGTYESWVKANWRNLTYTGTQVNPSIFSQAVSHSAAPVLITALWDQNKYNGTNPELTHPMNPLFSEIGLAEYANANFFSEDTIFTDYPHPAYENTTANLIERIARDGKLDQVWYVQGYTSLNLAAYSYFWDNGGLIPQGKWLYNLDSYVYSDYASQLIPRAVGYSTALLNYFFRGKMEVQPECVYRDPESDINDIPVTIKNLSLLDPNEPATGEDMSGNFMIAYRYKQHDEDENYTYGSSDVKTGVSISYGDKFTDLFYFSNSIPLDAEVIEYTVVFHGTLGHEEDAVVAQVFSSDVEDCCSSYLASWKNSGEIHGYGVGGFEVRCKWLDMSGRIIDNCSDVDLWLMNTQIERNQLKFTLNTVLDESWDDQVILSRDFPLPDNAPFLMFAASSEPEELMYSFMIRLDYGSCPVNNGLCLLSDFNPYIKQLDLVFSPSDPYVYEGEGCWESPWEDTPLRQCWIPFLPQDKPIIVNIPEVIQRMNLEMPQNIELWSSNMSGLPQEIRWGKICFMEERPDPVTFPHHYIE
jgi:hypothetical protein